MGIGPYRLLRVRRGQTVANRTPSPRVALSPSERGRSAAVHLLGGPWITIGERDHEAPDGSKKLLAFLALDRRPFDRHYVAGTLWPDSDEDRAGGCLRTSLWRLRQAGLDVIEGSKVSLRPLTACGPDFDRPGH